ncbi:putative E3 ubiquitin-protein ligase ARI4 [Rhypophila decipiens]|uniref:RBR-type E3 ubiquitin transferase n=1 Tax=Rhypophila decipiens TaxID=261697 RepID=A0AAN6YBH5_9PEZI|nr:putative E3 ubiquitin-protein ligase ARI4 [Rhypophila decipiens]
MERLNYTQGGHSTSRRTKHTAKSLVFSPNDWPRTSEPHHRPSPRPKRHGDIESSDVRPSSSHLRRPPSVTPTTPTSSTTGSTSSTTTPDQPTFSRSASMRASGTSGRGPRAPTISHHIQRPICVLEEGSDEDDSNEDDDDDEEEVVVPTFRSRSKSLHRESKRESKREARSRSAHPFPRSSNPFRSRSQSRHPGSRRDGSPRSAHPYRSTPVSRRSPRTSMSDSEGETDVSSVVDDRAIQPRDKALDAAPVLHMSMHDRINRRQDANSDQVMMDETQIYHVPSVGDEQPPSRRSSRRRDQYRRPQIVHDEYDDAFHQVYHHSSVDDERSRSRPKRTPRKYYESEGFTSKPAPSLRRAHTTGSHLASSQSMTSSGRRSTFVGSNYFGVPHQPQASETPARLVSCIICFDDEIPIDQSAKLKCRHRMCHSCLKRIFKVSIKDPQSMPPKCCAENIPLRHVEKLFDGNFKQTWNKKLAEYSTRNRIYCPSPRCGEWIKPELIRKGDDGRTYAKCSKCKTKVCCLCSSRWHSSRTCPRDEDTSQFLEQAQREGWKRCHKCKAMIELKEGCNHMTCRCGYEFCYICGSKWKSCECAWFNFENGESDPLEHMQFPAHASTRSYRHSSTPRFSSGAPSPPTPRDFRSEHRPSVAETIRPRPSSYDEEDFDRRLQEQREAHAHVSHQKMPSFSAFDDIDEDDDYGRDMIRGHDQRSRARRHTDEKPPGRRAATVIAPSPPQSRHPAVPPPLSSFERPNSGPDYGAGGAWTRGQLHHSPERWHDPPSDRRRASSPPRYRYPSPERHEEPPTPDRYHRPAESDRLRPRSPDRRRTSSFERRLADRFNSGSRHTAAHSAPIGPAMMGMMVPPMMGGPISPIRAGHPPPVHPHPASHSHPASHPMHHHHPMAHHPPIPMAPVPPPSGSGPMPPMPSMPSMPSMMHMRGIEIEEFFNNNRSSRSLEQMGTPKREKEAGGVGGTGSPHAPSVKRRPTGQAHREHMKQELLASVQAGLTGPGRGMDRVQEWRNYVEPGVPDGEGALSVVSGPSN